MQQSLDPAQAFEYQFVTSVQFDSGFSVDAFYIKVSTELTPWPCAITPSLPESADLALLYFRLGNCPRSNDGKIRTAIVARLRGYSAPSALERLFWPICMSSIVGMEMESMSIAISGEGGMAIA